MHHYLFPHRRNNFRPHIFSRESVAALALIMLLIQGAYLFQVHVVLQNTGFLASVLPAALTELTNTDRTAQGLPALIHDPELDRVAQAKANDMAAKGYFAHQSPEGKTPWHWLKQEGYEYTYAGENLAVDFTDSQDVEQAWMNSPTHRENILKAQYTHIGIAVAQGMYEGKQVTFVAQFFASKRTAPVAAAPTTPVRNTEVPATQIATVEPPPQSNRVLGTQAKPIAQSDAKDEVIAPVEQTVQQEVTGNIAVAATSPTQTLMYLFTGLTAVFALCLTIAVFVHIRRKYLVIEMMGGGLALIAIAVGFMFYDQGALPGVALPTDGQSASVIQSLR